MTKLEAIKCLRGFDHALLGQEDIDKICSPFGVKIEGYKNYESRDPKGLTLHPGPHVKQDEHGRYAIGMEASVFAARLCNQLNLEYRECGGRGFQLRACCEALEKYVGGTS